MDNHSLMFHDFKLDNTIGTQGAISQTDFKKLLRPNEKNYFSDPLEIQNRSNKNLESNSFITFDDGLLSQYEIAIECLKDTEIKGVFFVHSKPLIGEYDIHQVIRSFKNSSIFKNVDDFNQQLIDILISNFGIKEKQQLEINFINSNYLSEFNFYSNLDRKLRYLRDYVVSLNHYEDGIKELLNQKNVDIDDLVKNTYIGREKLNEINELGHIIGLHSHSHPTNLGKLDEAEQRYEIETNFEILKDLLDYEPNSISYPSNSYNNETLKILQDLKISYGFRADNKINSSPFELSRIDATIALNSINKSSL